VKVPTRAGPYGLAAIGLSIAATFTVAVAGPSVMEPALPGLPGQPPWAVNLRISAYVAVGLTALGLAAGTLGLVLVLRAMRNGWTFPARAVLIAGILAAAALALVPPFGSSDHLSYAAYGRMLVTGHNPYRTTPQQLINLGDPVARAVQDWRGQPSVYGPLATGIQGLASLIAGTSARLTVFLLGLVNLAAFTGTALLLHWMTRADSGRRLRAALLWAANPLLLQVLVAGAHVDVQMIVFCVAAMAVLYGKGEPTVPRALVAGLLVGLGFAVQPTAVLVGLGIAITQWRSSRGVAGGRPPAVTRRSRGVAGGRPPATTPSPRRLTALAAGFAVPAAMALAIGGSAMLKDMSQASDMVSIGSPWRLIRSGLQHLAGDHPASDIVRSGAIGLSVVLIAITAVVLVRTARSSARWLLPLALVLGWLFAWPYVLPWYDAFGWAFLALVPATQLDWLLLIRTCVLCLAYLPARSYGVHLPQGLAWLQPVFRDGMAPAVLAAEVVWLVLLMPWRSS
jgi:hypothetical protein